MNDRDIIIATIPMRQTPLVTEAFVDICHSIEKFYHQAGYLNPVTRFNPDMHALEIHVQRGTPSRIIVLDKQEEQKFLRYAMDQMSVELPALLPTEPAGRRTHEFDRHEHRLYNRTQNTKYNVALRHYNERKR